MSNLFIYGDSFAFHDPADNRYTTWPFLLAKGMGDCQFRNYSMWGSSQDWSWHTMRITMDQWQEGDVVVWCITDPSRFWFVESKPQFSNYASTVAVQNELTKGQRDAIEHFYKHISRPSLDDLMLDQRLCGISYLAEKAGVKFMLLPSFPQYIYGKELGGLADVDLNYGMDFAQGSLMYVQQREWAQISESNYYNIVNWKGFELRPMHMCLRNHRVLADKLLAWIKENAPVDLRKGFHKGFIPASQSIEGIEDELSPQFVNQYKGLAVSKLRS